jgi:hypothetical protein
VYNLLFCILLVWTFLGYFLFHRFKDAAGGRFVNLRKSFQTCLHCFTSGPFGLTALIPYFSICQASVIFFLLLSLSTEVMGNALIIAVGNVEYKKFVDANILRRMECRKNCVFAMWKLFEHNKKESGDRERWLRLCSGIIYQQHGFTAQQADFLFRYVVGTGGNSAEEKHCRMDQFFALIGLVSVGTRCEKVALQVGDNNSESSNNNATDTETSTHQPDSQSVPESSNTNTNTDTAPQNVDSGCSTNITRSTANAAAASRSVNKTVSHVNRMMVTSRLSTTLIDYDRFDSNLSFEENIYAHVEVSTNALPTESPAERHILDKLAAREIHKESVTSTATTGTTGGCTSEPHGGKKMLMQYAQRHNLFIPKQQSAVYNFLATLQAHTSTGKNWIEAMALDLHAGCRLIVNYYYTVDVYMPKVVIQTDTRRNTLASRHDINTPIADTGTFFLVQIGVFEAINVVMHLLLLIQLDFITLASEHADVIASWTRFGWVLELYFWIEMLIRMASVGETVFMSTQQNRAHVYVNIASLVCMIAVGNGTSERTQGTIAFSLLIIVQCLRIFRVLSALAGVRTEKFLDITSTIFKVFLIQWSVIYFFATIAQLQFCGSLNPNDVDKSSIDDDAAKWPQFANMLNFSTMLFSLFTMFEMSVLGNWSIVMDALAAEHRPHSVQIYAFFFIFRLLMTLVIYPLLMSFVIRSFISLRDSLSIEKELQKEQRYQQQVFADRASRIRAFDPTSLRDSVTAADTSHNNNNINNSSVNRKGSEDSSGDADYENGEDHRVDAKHGYRTTRVDSVISDDGTVMSTASASESRSIASAAKSISNIFNLTMPSSRVSTPRAHRSSSIDDAESSNSVIGRAYTNNRLPVPDLSFGYSNNNSIIDDRSSMSSNASFARATNATPQARSGLGSICGSVCGFIIAQLCPCRWYNENTNTVMVKLFKSQEELQANSGDNAGNFVDLWSFDERKVIEKNETYGLMEVVTANWAENERCLRTILRNYHRRANRVSRNIKNKNSSS